MSRTAEINVSVNGADEAVQKAKSIKTAFSEAAEVPGAKWKKFGDVVASSVSGMISDIARVATVAQGISFAQSVASAKQYQETIGRMAAYTGQSFASLDQKYTALSKAKLVPEKEIAAFHKSLGRMTYDVDGSIQAFAGLADEAIATGKSAGEMAPLGATLHNVLGVSGDTVNALKKIRGQAEALGMPGGAEQLQDQLLSVAGALSTVSIHTDIARNKMTALVGSFQQGSTDPNHGSKAFSALQGYVSGNPVEIARHFGMKLSDMFDSEGKQKDPMFFMKELKKLTKSETGMRRLVNTVGPEAAFALKNNKDLDNDLAAVAGAKPSNAAAGARSGYIGSEAGQREKADQEKERNARAAAEKYLPFLDSINSLLAKSPIVGAAALGVGGNLLAGGASSAIKAGAKGLFSVFGGAAAAGGEAAAAGGGAAAAGGGAVAAGLAVTAGAGLAALAVGGGIGLLADHFFDISGKTSTLFSGGTNKEKEDAADAEIRRQKNLNAPSFSPDASPGTPGASPNGSVNVPGFGAIALPKPIQITIVNQSANPIEAVNQSKTLSSP